MISFFMLPVYTRWLTTSDYGTMELLEITSGFIGALVGSRFGDALTNTYFNATTDTERRRTVSTALVGMSIAGAAVVGLSFLFAPYLSRAIFGSSEQTEYFHYTFAALGIFLPSEAVFAYIRALNKSALYSALQIARMLIMVLLNLLFLVGMHLGIRGILFSSMAGAAITQVALTVFAVSRCGWAFDASIFKRQLRFSAPLVIGPAGMMFVHYGDRMFLKGVVSLGDIGIYALAYKIGMLVSYLVNPVLFYWRSQMYEMMKPGADRIYPRLVTYMTLFIVTLGLLCALFARPVVELLAGSAFQQAAVFVPLVSLGYVMLNVSEFFRSILLFANRPGREAHITAVGAVFCLVAYSALIPTWKLWGAAAASAATFAVLLIYGVWQAQKAVPAHLEAGRLARIVFGALTAFAVYTILPRQGFWLETTEATASWLYMGFYYSGPGSWRRKNGIICGYWPPDSAAGRAVTRRRRDNARSGY